MVGLGHLGGSFQPRCVYDSVTPTHRQKDIHLLIETTRFMDPNPILIMLSACGTLPSAHFWAANGGITWVDGWLQVVVLQGQLHLHGMMLGELSLYFLLLLQTELWEQFGAACTV